MRLRNIALAGILVVCLIGALGAALSGSVQAVWRRSGVATLRTIQEIASVIIGPDIAKVTFAPGGSGPMMQFASGGALTLDARGTDNEWFLDDDGVIKIRSTATCPATCVVGSLCHDDNAPAQAQLLVCETTDNWVAQGTGAGGDIVLVNTGATTNPDFTTSADITVVNTSNTITFRYVADSLVLTTDTSGNYADGDAEAGAALTGDSATLFFSSGTIINDRIAGDLTVSGGQVSSSTIILNGGVAPTPTLEGHIQWEDDDDHIIVGDAVDQVEFVPTEDVSGDITMTTAGVVSIDCTNCILEGEIATGAVTADEIQNDAVGTAAMDDANFGDWTCLTGNCTLNANVVDNTAMADNAIGQSEMADNAIGSSEMADDAIAAAEMADADHGDIAWSGGVATVQAIKVVTDAPATCVVGEVILDTNGNTSGDNCGADTSPQLCICQTANTWFAIDLVP